MKLKEKHYNTHTWVDCDVLHANGEERNLYWGCFSALMTYTMICTYACRVCFVIWFCVACDYLLNETVHYR